MKTKIVILVVMMAALALVACGGQSEAKESTPPRDNPTANCPEPIADTRLLTHAGHGYCLLYPDGFKIEKPNPNETVLVIDSLLNVQDPRASIAIEPADGRTAEDAVDQFLAVFQLLSEPERSSVTVGGQEAIVLDKLPGQEINRRVFLVHDGRLYQMTFTPADESLGEAYAGMEALYEGIIGSFTLLPPVDEAALGVDCLEPHPDELSLTYEAYNFCVLVPNSYDVDETVANQVAFYVGSPLDVEHPRLFINVGDAEGRTAEQVADELAADVQASIPGYQVERTFGLSVGYDPAWVLENMPGQEISRRVVVVHGDRLYELTFVPADPSNGEMYAQMEQLYTTVVNAFRFLR